MSKSRPSQRTWYGRDRDKGDVVRLWFRESKGEYLVAFLAEWNAVRHLTSLPYPWYFKQHTYIEDAVQDYDICVTLLDTYMPQEN